MSKTGLAAAWVAATLLATLLVFAAVSFVTGDLRNGPQVIGTVAVATLRSTLPAGGASTTSTLSTGLTPSTEVTVATPPSTDSPADTAPPVTQATNGTPPPPTTVPSSSADAAVVSSVGGSAGLSCSGDAISLDWFTPASGFSPEVEHAGPSEVELKFESKDWKSKIHADCNNGAVVHDVDEDDESS